MTTARHHPTFEHILCYSDGRVFNTRTGRLNSIPKNGYSRMRVNGGRRVMVHRLVAQSFHQNPQNLAVVNHIDGNVRNNSAANLEFCSQRYNTQSINTRRDFGGICETGGRFRLRVKILGERRMSYSFASREEAERFRIGLRLIAMALNDKAM